MLEFTNNSSFFKAHQNKTLKVTNAKNIKDIKSID